MNTIRPIAAIMGNTNNSCFDYDGCQFPMGLCDDGEDYPRTKYNDVSAAWILICAMIVFFMKAGFMLMELSFAQSVKERRHVVIVKQIDVFASAFGYFLFGFYISGVTLETDKATVEVDDPLSWFFKFTFASNAATIVGGCLVDSKYKLRIFAAFYSAFMISGLLHPVLARIVWTELNRSLSPYRFCNSPPQEYISKTQGFNCSDNDGMNYREHLYVLDFAGGGAVHVLGGVAGLVISLFTKLQNWRDREQGPSQAKPVCQ